MVKDNRQTLILVLLFIVFGVQVGRHINNFYVPESDFFDYRAKAIQLRNFELPENFKRPPLYPISIAIFSLPFQGKFRELYAAEFILVLSAVFSLFFVYRISKYFLGKHAFWVTWLFALHPITLRMTIKPKSEMLVTVLILWAFDRFFKGDRKAYLLAFLASMVRYEGALVIAAFFVTDFFYNKERKKSLIYSVLAGLPLIIWTLAQSGGDDGASYGNYFTSYEPNFLFLLTFWVGLIRFLPLLLFRIWILMGSIFLGIGLVYGINNFRKETVALIVFLTGFILLHLIWPFSNIDYTVIVSWIVFLFVAFAIVWINKIYSKTINAFLDKRWVFFVGCFSFLALLIFVVFFRYPRPQYNVDAITIISFLIPVLLMLLNEIHSNKLYCRTVFGMTIFLLLAFLLNSHTNAEFFDIFYSKAEFRKAGEWFETFRNDGDRLAVAQPNVVSYFTNLDPDLDFMSITDIPPIGPLKVRQWLLAHNTSHIAWFSTNKIDNEGDAWNTWQIENRGWRTIQFLENGIDIPGFKMVHEIRVGPRWGYIYKVETVKE